MLGFPGVDGVLPVPSTLVGVILLPSSLYCETQDLFVNRFGTCALYAEAGYIIRELVLHTQPVLYVIFLLG